MKQYYDVVIVGSGIAGLYTALHIAQNRSVLCICKEATENCNSSLAQGGIAGVLDDQHDSVDIHLADTLRAGQFANNSEAVTVMVTEARPDIETLISYGVEFDRQDGELHFTLEGGHSVPRILHHRDSTGEEIATKLMLQAKNRSNITMVEHTIVHQIDKVDHAFLLQLLSKDQSYQIYAGCCVLATGGIGQVYRHTTNSDAATGDGIMLARQLGAAISELRYVQFHPTGFAGEKNTHSSQTFLISEAVRGEGAYLKNTHGERFMSRYDQRGELAPRDVVSKAMLQEQARTGSNSFYLDITHKPADHTRERFPRIAQNLRSCGFDLTTQLIPVYPCQHYAMGGIAVDLQGCTDIGGLYAVGECSNTGVHGKNRLASNSLLESIVFARRAATHINQTPTAPQTEATCATNVFFRPTSQQGEKIQPTIRNEIQSIMQAAFFVIPNDHQVAASLEKITSIKRELEMGHYYLDSDYVEAKSLATVAECILQELLVSKTDS